MEPVVTKRLGALPVAAELLRRLDVAGTVDALCPSAPSAHLTHGQVIETLVANRLTSRMPLYRVSDWARTWAVEEVFGIEPDLLNDDRLARALDAIAPHPEKLAGTVGARAIAEFGIDCSRLHWDMTRMSVHGPYPEADQDEDFPSHQVRASQRPPRGPETGPGRHRGLRRWWHPGARQVFDDGAAEVSQIIGAMRDLRQLVGEQELLTVADSKLVSYTNISALLKSKVPFIAPVPAAQISDGFYASLDLDRATVVDWVPARDAHKDSDQRESRRVLKDVHVISTRRPVDTSQVGEEIPGEVAAAAVGGGGRTEALHEGGSLLRGQAGGGHRRAAGPAARRGAG
ncbi:DUF4277 domain-containing protein [Streptomyces sp. NPDC056165]|uniref:DUF4277 domain-containing protein n=1 Tax=Streptomyces sp. NPDC056165 TaxID=3345733 RepID=UPI0035E01136